MTFYEARTPVPFIQLPPKKFVSKHVSIGSGAEPDRHLSCGRLVITCKKDEAFKYGLKHLQYCIVPFKNWCNDEEDPLLHYLDSHLPDCFEEIWPYIDTREKKIEFLTLALQKAKAELISFNEENAAVLENRLQLLTTDPYAILNSDSYHSAEALLDMYERHSNSCKSATKLQNDYMYYSLMLAEQL
jgi:hypothetical protein